MIKLFKPYLQQLYKQNPCLIAGFLLVVIAGGAGIALLGLSGWFISSAAFAGLSAATAAQFNYLLPGASVRLFAYIRILARYGERVINHEAVFKSIGNLRVWLFDHITRLSPLQLALIKNGDLLNRFISDVGALDNLFLRILSPIMSAFLLIMLSIAFLFFINKTIAITIFISLLILLLLLYMLLKMDNTTSRVYQQTTNNLRSMVTHTTQALQEIFLFNSLNTQKELFDKKLVELTQIQEKINKKNSMAQAILILGMGMILIITLLLSINFTLKNAINGAYIALIFLVIFALTEILQPLITAILLMGKTQEAALNINQLISTKPNFTPSESSRVEIKNEPKNILFSDVTFSYANHSKFILNQFNLEIPAGEHRVLVGQSGIGKTTLINLMARFIVPQTGIITINHVDLLQLTQQEWLSLFCIVPQKPYLFDTTLRENLLLANPYASDDSCWKALEICQLKDFIASLPRGLDTYLGKNGEYISGGQARRLALTQAVLKNAPITLLDEPTEDLDQLTEIAIINALRKHFINKTLLVATHRMAVINVFSPKQIISTLS